MVFSMEDEGIEKISTTKDLSRNAIKIAMIMEKVNSINLLIIPGNFRDEKYLLIKWVKKMSNITIIIISVQ